MALLTLCTICLLPCSLRVAIGFVWQILLVVVVAVGAGLYSDYLVPRGAPPIPPQVFKCMEVKQT